MKAMIIPGNGNADISEIWCPYVRDHLLKLKLEVIAENMPDPELARKEYWLPFIKGKVEPDSILIGHSSGAIATMRHLEKNTCSLAILIGAYHTDLGYDSEKKSGYFDEKWDWDAIKKNAKKIVIFASKDDPFIPIEEAQYLKESLNAEYHEYIDEKHFSEKKEFPEIITVVQKFLSINPN
jgi:predicted alpha/beta hydrolase family esterase